jgi:very-short-patch-repair endonuclease
MTRRAPEKTAFARQLRREPSKAETLLWNVLRNRQIDGVKFVRQEPVGPYFADFLCRVKKLVIEIDGATHGTDAELSYDAARASWLEANGYRVIRFGNTNVYEAMDWVVGEIAKTLKLRPL